MIRISDAAQAHFAKLLANHPILLAVLAAISVILLAWVLWRLLRIISRRRLNPDNE